jgi:hypothetical protein
VCILCRGGPYFEKPCAWLSVQLAMIWTYSRLRFQLLMVVVSVTIRSTTMSDVSDIVISLRS